MKEKYRNLPMVTSEEYDLIVFSLDSGIKTAREELHNCISSIHPEQQNKVVYFERLINDLKEIRNKLIYGILNGEK